MSLRGKKRGIQITHDEPVCIPTDGIVSPMEVLLTIPRNRDFLPQQQNRIRLDGRFAGPAQSLLLSHHWQYINVVVIISGAAPQGIRSHERVQ